MHHVRNIVRSPLSQAVIAALAGSTLAPAGAALAAATPDATHEAIVQGLLDAQARGEAAASTRRESAAPAFAHPLVPVDALSAGLQGTDFAPAQEIMSAGSTEAKRVSLRAFDTPVKNQSERGWCTAFATVAALENLAKRRSGKELNLSEIHHWSHYQQYDMFASVEAARTHRIAPETVWSYRQAKPAGVDARGVASITGSAELRTRAEVLAAIDAGRPVVFGTEVTPSWNSTTNGSVSTAGASVGGHAIALVGYGVDARVGGGGYFVIKNSWSRSWGDAGYGYVPFSQCEKHWCGFIDVKGVKVAP